MKKTILGLLVSILLFSCGNATNSPEGAAQSYCDLSKKADSAEGAEKEKLNQELNDFENKIEEEHKGDETWFNTFEEKVEEICEKG